MKKTASKPKRKPVKKVKLRKDDPVAKELAKKTFQPKVKPSGKEYERARARREARTRVEEDSSKG